MSTKGQDYSNLSDSICLNFFSSITTKPVVAKFHVSLRGMGEQKLVHMVQQGHMIKMDIMPIYGTNL